jgi:hypothetical protein
MIELERITAFAILTENPFDLRFISRDEHIDIGAAMSQRVARICTSCNGDLSQSFDVRAHNIACAKNGERSYSGHR